MTYGPTKSVTPSVLARSGDGSPIWCWDNGLISGPLPTAPPMVFELELPDGSKARASFPSAVKRVLVDDPQRERVTMHWGKVVRSAWLGLRRKVAAGVHVFVEERSDNLIVLEVVPSNGQIDPTKHHSHLGAVRYRGARLKLLDPTWAIAGETGTGVVELCPPGDHYLPSRAWTSFRFVAYRRADPTGIGRAIALASRVGLVLPPASIVAPDLIFYPRTGYAPQQPIPNQTAHGLVPRVGMLWYDRDDENDPAKLPKGAPDAPAGWRVEPTRAWQANEQAAIAAANDVQRSLAGHPVATFDLNTGEPVYSERWPQRGEYALTGQRVRFDPWVTPSSGTLVTEQGWATTASNREFNPGLCASKAQAMLYTNPYDEAHESRILATLFSAWSLTRSWAAWLAMRAIAADVLTSWTLYGRPWDQYWKAFSLGTALANARQYPGRGGVHYLRERGWGPFYATACALALEAPGPDRDRLLGYRAALLELKDQACVPSGIDHLGWSGHNYNYVPWSQHGIPREYQVAAVFQVAIESAGLYALLVVGPRTPWSAGIVGRIVAAARSLYDNPALPLVGGSPPYYVCTGLNGMPETPIRLGGNQLAHASVIHGYDHLARCTLLTGNRYWIDEVALRLAPNGAWPSVAAMRNYLASTMDCWRALAFAQINP